MPIETFETAIDLGQHRGGGQEFEGAAHGEALIGAVHQRRSAPQVERRDAEPSACPHGQPLGPLRPAIPLVYFRGYV